MKTNFLKVFALLFSTIIYAQAGHIMQGVGAVNMSMGGAATAQPLDISGAMQWNPATLSTFDEKIIKFDLGLFFSSPELKSTFGPYSGVTEDDRGMSPMPALAMVWGKPESKHTFGVSAFGISGFGVDFPQETNLPINADWNPNNSNAILYPQELMGFGNLHSEYMLLQIGFTWAYNFSEKL